MAQWSRICQPVQETWVQSLGREDPLEKEMATHSSILAWEIPWAEESGGLESMKLQRDKTQLSNYTATTELTRVTMLYIPRTYLFYNSEFVPFDLLYPFCLPSLPSVNQ